MPLASEIVNKALSIIQVKMAGVTPTPDEISDAIEDLNDMMVEWASLGIDLGYQKVNASTDETSIPDWANFAVKGELGTRIAPQYGKVLDPNIIARINAAKRAVIHRTTQLPDVHYPSILPTGGGHGHRHAGHFFPNVDANNLLSVQNGVLVTGEGKDIDVEIEQ